MKKDLIHFIRWELVADDQVEKVLAGLPQWGVRDIVAHPKWFRDGGESYVEKIARLLKKYDLRSTACHALWGDGNDCIIPDPAAWADMIRRQTLFMEQLQVLGVTTFTIHTGMLPDLPADDNLGLLRKTIDALLPCCEKTGITLAVENSAEPLPFIQDVAGLIREYRHDRLGMCFDCGHANCYGGGVGKVLGVMKDHIVTCHLHDNYGEHDDHNPPGGGNIDWPELDVLLDTLPRLKHAETESGIWDEPSWKKFCEVLGKN